MRSSHQHRPAKTAQKTTCERSGMLPERQKACAWALTTPSSGSGQGPRSNHQNRGSLHLDVRGGRHHAVQAARTRAPDDSVVALLTPRLPPAVPDGPVLGAILHAEANDGHAMVQTLRVASGLILLGDAPSVDLHGPGIDADG